MKSRRLGRMLGALAGPGAILFSIAVACEPQDIYLFDESASSPEDAGSDEPEPEPPPETEPEPPPDDEEPVRVQPACASPACEACVERDDCNVAVTAFFCHPETGECKLACDPEAAGETRACTANEQCDPRFGLCVECVTNDDCGDGALSVCDARRGRCVECVESVTCPIARPVCDPDALLCVECLNDAQCATGEICLPGPQRCAQCRDDSDCRGLEDDNLCLIGEQRCVECIDDSDCTEDAREPFCSSENECEDERE